MLRIGGKQFPVFKPYGKPAYEIFVAGCDRKCPGCLNEELADKHFGQKVDVNALSTAMLSRTTFFDVVSISGGDLLCQNGYDAFEFVSALRKVFPDKDFWLFTGEDIVENIPQWAKDLFDVIKMGSYKQELKEPEGTFPASSNQRVLRKGTDY
jgi:anaerobic ribonucleoside-triphosphate reductase activating protein